MAAVDPHEDDPFAEVAPVVNDTFFSGWRVTLGDDLAASEPEVIKTGTCIAVSPLDKEDTERAVYQVRHRCQIRIDWHWKVGRALVKAIGTEHQLAEARAEWERQLRHFTLEMARENLDIERRHPELA